MKTLQNFINGKSVPSSSDKTQDLINPATGQVFAKAPVSNAKDIDSAMKAAEKAFESWRDSTPGERQKAINKIADAIESRSEELIKIVEASSHYPDIVRASQIRNGNTNPTIGKYDYVVSKTGYIHLSGGCIVAKVKDRIVVILGSKNVKTRIPELEKLITLKSQAS